MARGCEDWPGDHWPLIKKAPVTNRSIAWIPSGRRREDPESRTPYVAVDRAAEQGEPRERIEELGSGEIAEDRSPNGRSERIHPAGRRGNRVKDRLDPRPVIAIFTSHGGESANPPGGIEIH